MMSRTDALDLDAHDVLARFGEQFHVTDPSLCYLDGNSLGRMPKSTADKVAEFLTEDWGTNLVEGWAHWIDRAEIVGDLIGRATLGAAAGQTLAMDTTSVNFYRAIRAAVTLRPGRKTIVADEANFPTDRYILQGIANELGMKLVVIPNDVKVHTTGEAFSDELVTAEILKPYLDDDVAVVTMSVVQYRSGALNDVAGLTALAHDHGALVVWDASHAVGAVAIECDRDQVDFMVGCTYKYGNSGPGAPAWLYVAKQHQQNLDMPIYGWFAQRNQFLMGSDFNRNDGMRGFQIASPSIIGLLCIEQGFSMIEEAGISNIHAKAERGTSMMVDIIDEKLAPLGFEIITPHDPKLRGGHISIYHEEAERISRGMRSAINVIPDYRSPNCIRLAISPLPTSYVEVWDGLNRLHDYVVSNEWQKLSKTPPKVT